METMQISDRLQLHRALSQNEWQWPVDPKCVLVLFFPWLGAKEKHIEKYRELYTNLGVDVLTIRSAHTDFLWPPNSVKLAKHTLKALDERFKDYEHFICHSISIGSYNFSVLNMVIRNLNSKNYLMEKFRGIIFDSIVVGRNAGGIIKDDADNKNQVSKLSTQPVHAIDRMIKGLAKSVSLNSYVQSLITFIAKMYFSATKKQTLDFYEKALDVVRDKPFKVPTLVLSSKNDPLSDVVVVQKLVKIWQTESNVPVTLRIWDNSVHAYHLKYHRDEYISLQKSFLNQVFPETPEHSSGVNKSKL